MLIHGIYHLKSIFTKIFFKILYRNRISFGKGVHWRKQISIDIDRNSFLKIGKNVFFNNFCSINVKKCIVIGDNTLFGENVKIYDHNHVFNRKNLLIKDSGYTVKELIIGSNCWICSNVVLLKGCKIGNNCVVSAGCIIDFEVPDNTIVKRVSKSIICENILKK